MCLRANKYRFSYGRQANRTLKDLLVPSLDEMPEWVQKIDVHRFDNVGAPFQRGSLPEIEVDSWKWFEIGELFKVKKGKRLTKSNMRSGSTPFIGASDSNNGLTSKIDLEPIHEGNTISVSYDGSVAEAFYQPVSFWALDSVNVLYPKFKLNKFIALFIITILRKEKYRFNYGRKWHVERMETSKIKLPINENGEPDFAFMEKYIKKIPYSSSI